MKVLFLTTILLLGSRAYSAECKFKITISSYSISGDKVHTFFSDYPNTHTHNSAPLSYPVIEATEEICELKPCTLKVMLAEKNLKEVHYKFNNDEKRWEPKKMPPKVLPIPEDLNEEDYLNLVFLEKDKEICSKRVELEVGD